MSDIAERLRDYIKRGLLTQPVVEEAASRIEQLETALTKIDKLADGPTGDVYEASDIARRALGEKT